MWGKDRIDRITGVTCTAVRREGMEGDRVEEKYSFEAR
jgi:hypothetical protein